MYACPQSYILYNIDTCFRYIADLWTPSTCTEARLSLWFAVRIVIPMPWLELNWCTRSEQESFTRDYFGSVEGVGGILGPRLALLRSRRILCCSVIIGKAPLYV